ncbi:hypothetical protein LCGC14_0196430 [marine sediment metagenome]|uniref:Uncharacterized protein n=1 Tax=marine sediment metagenome TaxID=412755 RepID=A0A0F9UKQ0_9ZZZZ
MPNKINNTNIYNNANLHWLKYQDKVTDARLTDIEQITALTTYIKELTNILELNVKKLSE